MWNSFWIQELCDAVSISLSNCNLENLQYPGYYYHDKIMRKYEST